MEKRSQKVLEAAVQGFINLGEPISSNWLYRHCNFGIKPATIRLELEKLSNEGYLLQPHHSAGRVPTDKGYELFADFVMEGIDSRPTGIFYKSLRGLFNEKIWSDLLGVMTSHLGLLGLVEDLNTESVYTDGLRDLVEHLETESSEELKSVIRDCADIQEKVSSKMRFFEDMDGPDVFVGRNNPIVESDNLSLVAAKYDLSGDEILLLALGPKRMDYKKVLKTFKSFYYQNGGRK